MKEKANNVEMETGKVKNLKKPEKEISCAFSILYLGAEKFFK